MFCIPLVNMFTSSPDPLNTCRLQGIQSYCTQHINLILFCLNKQSNQPMDVHQILSVLFRSPSETCHGNIPHRKPDKRKVCMN